MVSSLNIHVLHRDFYLHGSRKLQPSWKCDLTKFWDEIADSGLGLTSAGNGELECCGQCSHQTPIPVRFEKAQLGRRNVVRKIIFSWLNLMQMSENNRFSLISITFSTCENNENDDFVC